MPHDAHFLERLDRVDRKHVELALGLYRDHDLVRYILSHTRLAEGVERIAIALEEGRQPPHIIVARTGAFVTCLGRGMSTGELPVVTRAHLDGLASKFQRVREGLELAKKRGVDETRLLDRIESAGPAITREDFLAACAILGPAVPLLFGVYSDWAITIHELHPLLQTTRRSAAPQKTRAERDLARGAWACAHAAMILVDSASREWVREWASFPEHSAGSAWGVMVTLGAFPFVMRAAWLAGRLGKPMLASYKERFAKPSHVIELREAGLGLACMALRHGALRSEVLKVLRSPPGAEGQGTIDPQYTYFAELVALVEAKEESLRTEALDLGRKIVIERTRHVPTGSPYHFADASDVPDDLALPALFSLWYDALNGERAGDLTLIGVVAAAHARAEDFYYPSAAIHVMASYGLQDLQEAGQSLVEIHHRLLGTPRTVVRAARPGRNDPCPCGSGKKYKKCHGP